jgi:hypothetical protein
VGASGPRIIGGSSGKVSNPAIDLFVRAFGQDNNADEEMEEAALPTAGTAGNLYIKTDGPVASGTTLTFTVRRHLAEESAVPNSSTSLHCSIVGAAFDPDTDTDFCKDTHPADAVSFAAGDEIDLEVHSNGGPASVGLIWTITY